MKQRQARKKKARLAPAPAKGPGDSAALRNATQNMQVKGDRGNETASVAPNPAAAKAPKDAAIQTGKENMQVTADRKDEITSVAFA